MKASLPATPAGIKIPKHPALIRRSLLAGLKQLQPKSPVLAGSLVLVLVHRRCGRPGCRCHKGQGHPTYYLTCKQQGNTRAVYVPKDLTKSEVA